MKVSVAVSLTYDYEVDLPDDIDQKDIEDYCDLADPAFSELAKVLSKYHLNFDSNILSITD